MFQINICRVCEKSTNLINISLPKNNHYVDQYLICANVSYKIDDGLPPYLCRLCATQLNYAYKFKQKCEETEVKLKKMLSLSLETSQITGECLNNLKEVDSNEEDLNDEDFKEDLNEEDFKEDLIEEDSNKLNESTLNVDENHSTSEKVIFRCDICKFNKKFYGMHTLEKHMCKNHGMKNNHRQCPICFKWLKAYHYYIKHMKLNKHSDKDGKCQYCGKTFKSWNVKRHIKAVHLELRPFICDICNKSFATKTTIEIHMVTTHKSEYNFFCSICNKPYKLKASLKLHEMSHIPIDEQEKKKTLICQFCGKRFKMKFHFLLHENEHTGNITNTKERLHECGVCKRSFHSKGNLKMHQLTHTGVKAHKCYICNKSFSLLSNLQRHGRVHTGEKPFQCSYCDKTFAQAAPLKAHERIHTGEKPYKCEHCSKCFTDCSTWIRHKKVHL